MISKEHFLYLRDKYGAFASWAVWAEPGKKPKSNIGDMSIFDLNTNPKLLEILNPNVILVGLNIGHCISKEPFINFHSSSSKGQDYKIRYALQKTEFYGAYMTDIIKDFEELISGNVPKYLKNHKDFEKQNIELFKQEINDLQCSQPLIIAFGNIVYDILKRNFGDSYEIKKITHYSHYISKESYREEVLNSLCQQ